MGEGAVLGLQYIGSGLLLVQLAIYIGLFRHLIGYRHSQEPPKSAFTGGTTVIIAARNEAENLDANLPYILDQDHERFEVIVVNDHSSDETIPVVRGLQKTYNNLELVNMDAHVWQKPGKKLALLLGIKKAQYEVMLFTDADCKPASQQWISSMEAPFEKPETAFAIGVAPYQKGKGFLSTVVRYETFATAFKYIGLGLAGIPYMGVGRNLAYRKSFFLDSGGFGPHHYLAAGDDDLLVNQLATDKNTAIVLDHEGFTWSLPPGTWRSWVKQKQRHLSIGKYYKLRDKLLLGGLWLLQAGLYSVMLFLLILNPYAPFSWGLLAAHMVVFYAVNLPALKHFQLTALTLRAFGLDIFYQLLYVPLMGLLISFSKKSVEWR